MKPLIVDMGCESIESARAVFDATSALASMDPNCPVAGFAVLEQLKEAGCKLGSLPENAKVYPCADIVPMDGKRSSAIRMPDSTMTRAIDFLRNGDGIAMISTGSTPAYVAAASSLLERISSDLGVPLGAYMPLINPREDRKGTLLLDVGGCPDVKPEVLATYPELGVAYSRFVYGVENPISGLLNIGAERDKGNWLYKETQKLLGEQCPNLEPKPFIRGEADIAVMDGYTGNLAIKLIEAIFAEQAIYLKAKAPVDGTQGTRAAGTSPTPYTLAGRVFKEMMEPIALESGAGQLLNLKQGAFALHGEVSYEQALYGMKLMYTLGQNMESLIRALKDVHVARVPVSA